MGERARRLSRDAFLFSGARAGRSSRHTGAARLSTTPCAPHRVLSAVAADGAAQCVALPGAARQRSIHAAGRWHTGLDAGVDGCSGACGLCARLLLAGAVAVEAGCEQLLSGRRWAAASRRRRRGRGRRREGRGAHVGARRCTCVSERPSARQAPRSSPTRRQAAAADGWRHKSRAIALSAVAAWASACRVLCHGQGAARGTPPRLMTPQLRGRPTTARRRPACCPAFVPRCERS